MKRHGSRHTPADVALHRFLSALIAFSCVAGVQVAASPDALAAGAGTSEGGASAPTRAFADDVAPAPTNTILAPMAPPASPSAADPLWVVRYDVARRLLYQGDFEGAEREFAGLTATATREQDRTLASELASLCRVFRQRGARFAALAPMNPSSQVVRTRRTTDELAWLYTAAVLYGVGTGGFIAAETRPESTAAVILPALGLAGVAVGGVVLADAGDGLPYGVPQAITTGLELGLAEGSAWTLWNQSHVDSGNEWKAGDAALVVWGVTTAGGIAGGTIGAVAGTTPGRTSLVGSAGLWSAVVTGLLSASLSGDDHGQRDDHGLLAAGIGINAGAVAGGLLAGPMSPSVARVRFIDLGALAGGLVAGGIYASASNGFRGNNDDGTVRGLFATTGLGVAAGVAAATYFSRGMAPDRGLERRARETSPESALAVHAAPTVIAAAGGAMLGAAGTF